MDSSHSTDLRDPWKNSEHQQVYSARSLYACQPDQKLNKISKKYLNMDKSHLHFQLFHDASLLLADIKCVFFFWVLIVIMQLQIVCPDDDVAFWIMFQFACTSWIVTVSCPLLLGHSPTLLVLSTQHWDLKGFCLMYIQQWINIEKIIPHVFYLCNGQLVLTIVPSVFLR